MSGPSAARLDVLKALGDNTRYAIYLELARSPHPLATAEVAEHLDLHPNTVRPHLERMREVGLLEVEVDHRGGPGRPQHRYSTAPDAPGLGFEPPAYPLLASMAVRTARAAGAAADDALESGREQGAALAGAEATGGSDLDDLVATLGRLGFDPERVDDVGAGPTVAFAHCPYRAMAEADPDLVCSLHRGLVEGFLDGCAALAADGGARRHVVADFGTLVDRDPCRADLVLVDSTAAGGPTAAPTLDMPRRTP